MRASSFKGTALQPSSIMMREMTPRRDAGSLTPAEMETLEERCERFRQSYSTSCKETTAMCMDLEEDRAFERAG
jgi:hypothetical protein